MRDDDNHDGENFRSDRISGQLLTILDTILSERSVTRAAVKLNMSQSNTSAALARLRQLFGDPILVRGKPRMVPTEHGLELANSVKVVTDTFDVITARTLGPKQQSVPRRCVVACVDELSHFLARPITAAIRTDSAATAVEICSIGSLDDVSEKLETHEVDVAIFSQPPGSYLKSELIAEDEFVCVMGMRHRLAGLGSVSASQDQTLEHVSLDVERKSQGDGLATYLRSQGLRRKISVVLPYIDVIPRLVATSDMVFTTTRRFAQYHATLFPLHIASMGFSMPPVKHYQVWNPTPRDPHRVAWVLSKVRRACSALQGCSDTCIAYHQSTLEKTEGEI